jgi:hypothetical protein
MVSVDERVVITNFYKKHLDEILFSLFGSADLVNKWWLIPNKAFNNATPLEVLETEPKKVVRYLLSFV